MRIELNLYKYSRNLKTIIIMKKALFLCVSILFLASCKSALDTQSQSDIKGNWVITNVSYPGADVIKVNSFNIAEAKCFEGSQWKFVSNNNTGTMSLAKTGCPTFSSPIIWTITKTGDFTLKITEGEKAKNVTQGYFLKVRNQSENSFQLIDQVNVGGKNTEVIYHFTKQ